MSTRHAPTFDTAAFTAEELAAASVCGPTDLPDCVPGGCGGLAVDAEGVAKVAHAVVITEVMVQRARAVIIKGLGDQTYTDIARAALTAALSKGETP